MHFYKPVLLYWHRRLQSGGGGGLRIQSERWSLALTSRADVDPRRSQSGKTNLQATEYNEKKTERKVPAEGLRCGLNPGIVDSR